MAKIHPIERCIQCGAMTKPLIPSNHEDLIRVSNIVGDFNRQCETKDLENSCLFFTSAHSFFDGNSDIFYFLCAKCCRRLIQGFLPYLVRIRKEIIFQKFDEIKGELKNGR